MKWTILSAIPQKYNVLFKDQSLENELIRANRKDHDLFVLHIFLPLRIHSLELNEQKQNSLRLISHSDLFPQIRFGNIIIFWSHVIIPKSQIRKIIIDVNDELVELLVLKKDEIFEMLFFFLGGGFTTKVT